MFLYPFCTCLGTSFYLTLPNFDFLFQTSSDGQGRGEVPREDQHIALCLLLELAMQRGALSNMLEAVLLLLQLWDKGKQEADNRCVLLDVNYTLSILY